MPFNRNHIGPIIPTILAKLLFKMSTLTNIHSDVLSILPSYTVTPSWDIRSLVFLDFDQNEDYFEELIRCSYVYHMFMSHFGSIKITGNPRREMYSYLGPKICPISFSNLENFWNDCRGTQVQESQTRLTCNRPLIEHAHYSFAGSLRYHFI